MKSLVTPQRIRRMRETCITNDDVSVLQFHGYQVSIIGKVRQTIIEVPHMSGDLCELFYKEGSLESGPQMTNTDELGQLK